MSEPERTPTFIFGGFDSPNTTQVPDAFFDVVAPQLSEAELRVVLYIIRRTFGFKKDSDTISLRQMVEGITTRDGRVLDRGTGLKKSAVANALNGLERKGVILSRRNRSLERGNEPTTYALHIKDQPLSVPVDKGLSIHTDKPLSVPVDTQYTERQETVEQHTVSSSYFDKFASLQKRIGSKNSKKGDRIFVDDAQIVDPDQNQSAKAPHGFTAVSQVLAKHQRARPTDAPRRTKTAPETADPPQSRVLGQSLTSEGRRGRPPKAPPAIEAYVEQFSDELHDEEHVPSNIGQAARLWKTSGTSEDHFLQLMHEARTITKKRGNIQKRAAAGGEYGLRNRMPYFFSVLRDLLGMKEDQASAGSPSQPR